MLRLAFMGTPDFAVPALRALLAAGHEVVAVYTQPPRPAGRGQAERPSPVHRLAAGLGLPVRAPSRLRRNEAAWAEFASLGLDAAIVAAYGLLLPAPMLAAPRLGCLNVHASLLPRWRGAAPIQAAILAGDAETGVTIMRMDEGLDTGPMLARRAVPITPATTGATLHDTLAGLGATLIVETLARPPAPTPQPEDGATYAPKLSRDDAPLDWTRAAAELERRIRAFDPWPGTTASLGETTLKILAATVVDGDGPPGTVLDEHLTVACGAGALRPTRVQRAGARPLATADFLRGHPVPAGTRLA